MPAGDERYSPRTDPFYQGNEPPSAEDLGTNVVVSPDARRAKRVPPGQVRTKKWPVLHAGRVPIVSPETWTLSIGGLVERPIRLTFSEWQTLPRTRVFADFHCVTRWSRLGNLWEGVSTSAIARIVGIHAESRFVVVGGFDDGWTTNLPLADFLGEDALFADRHDARPLTGDHGGPVRLIVPRLYAWKSAKWVSSVTFVRDDEPGYWERLGYHDHGDPWVQERFRSE